MSNGGMTPKNPESADEEAGLLGIYTITPTHCGSGQAAGAIDLPVVREAHTRFPYLPATAIKGVARQFVEGKDPALATRLFGPRLAVDEKQLFAGAMSVLEGALVAFPVRSLSRPFFHVTCPLVLERLGRALRAFGLSSLLPKEWATPSVSDAVLVSDETLVGKPLVLEDLVYTGDEVRKLTPLKKMAQWLSDFVPLDEKETAARIADGLVVVPDKDFADLVGRTLPVLARVSLNRETKTTDGKGGNLWYEEVVPSDTLFLAFLVERHQVTQPAARSEDASTNGEKARLRDFTKQLTGTTCLQIGGNETVGQGQTLWTYRGRA